MSNLGSTTDLFLVNRTFGRNGLNYLKLSFEDYIFEVLKWYQSIILEQIYLLFPIWRSFWVHLKYSILKYTNANSSIAVWFCKYTASHLMRWLWVILLPYHRNIYKFRSIKIYISILILGSQILTPSLMLMLIVGKANGSFVC